jgi:hypothetical protein
MAFYQKIWIGKEILYYSYAGIISFLTTLNWVNQDMPINLYSTILMPDTHMHMTKHHLQK